MAATYTLLGTRTATDSSTYTFPNSLTDPNVVLDFTLNVPNEPTWVRAGYVKAVSTTALGELSGKSQLVIFGRQELVLNVPQFPYKLQFKPSPYITAWKCDLYDSIPDYDYATLSANSGLTQAFLKSRTVDELSLLTALFPATPWIEPTLKNGYANFNNGYQSMGYRKRGRTVEIQGLCTKSSSSAGETEIFTLPIGMRPIARISLQCPGAMPSSATGYRVDVLADGRVLVVQPTANSNPIYVLLSSTFSL